MKLPNSKTLFLIDSLGALLSAIAYFFFLTEFEALFGIPKSILITLSCLAFIYFIYSGICYLVNPKIWQPYLAIIAIANLMHCCLTGYFTFSFFQEISKLGVLFFIVEILIVASLAIIELKVAFKKKS